MFAGHRGWLTIRFVCAVALAFPAGFARSDEIAEFLFWDSMGNAMGDAVSSYQSYQQERQLWTDNIAKAKRELDACGGCPSAQAELDKWQGVEDQFQDIAGTLAQSVGMPPILAKTLGIDLPGGGFGPLPPFQPLSREDFQIPTWAKEKPEFCQAAVAEFVACLNAEQATHGSVEAFFVEPGHACWDGYVLQNACQKNDLATFDRRMSLIAARQNGIAIPEYGIGSANTKITYYGPVEPDFVPDLPPPATVMAEFEASIPKGTAGPLDFRMRKTGVDGVLNAVSIRTLNIHDVLTSDINCTRPQGRSASEEQICEDVRGLVYRDKDFVFVIGCNYDATDNLQRSRPNEDLHWYHVRPAAAEPSRLSGGHPLGRIGPAIDACPLRKDPSGGGEPTEESESSGAPALPTYVLLQPGPDLAPGSSFATILGSSIDSSEALKFMPEAIDMYYGEVNPAEVIAATYSGISILMTESEIAEVFGSDRLENYGTPVPVVFAEKEEPVAQPEVSAAPVPSAFADADILGVRLGMDLASAERAVRDAIDIGVVGRLRKSTLELSFREGLVLVAADGSEQMFLVTSPAHPDTVVAVARYVVAAEGVDEAKLKSLLADRYGLPTYVNPGRAIGRAVWTSHPGLTHAGAPIQDYDYDARCYIELGGDLGVMLETDAGLYTDEEAPVPSGTPLIFAGGNMVVAGERPGENGLRTPGYMDDCGPTIQAEIGPWGTGVRLLYALFDLRAYAEGIGEVAVKTGAAPKL